MAISRDTILDASDFRFPDADYLDHLGYLKDLAGTWQGGGLNLIARPAFHYTNSNNPPHQPDLFLQINFTREMLKFHPIGSNVPNRGLLQDDVILHGLTYLQQISDAAKPGIGAMHIEPGIWIRESPGESKPSDTPPPGGQVVTRMASIPHGNAILAQGVALPFTGEPVLPLGSAAYNGSLFPSFNSTPFAVAPSVGPIPTFNAATTSMAQLAAANGGPPFPNFPQYTLGNALTNHDPGSRPAGLTQAEINDPIVVLQNAVQQNLADGYEYEGGIAINICTASEVHFQPQPNGVIVGAPPPIVVGLGGLPSLNQFNGGVQNTVFLADRQPVAPPSGNALTQIVYATFWIEKLRHKVFGQTMTQLQYAQMVTLNFPAINIVLGPPAPPGPFNLAWPHITVGTLTRMFAA